MNSPGANSARLSLEAPLSPECGYQFRTFPRVSKQARTRGNSMTRYLVLGIICMLSALVLSCVAGMYAAINSNVAIATACTACLALVVGVKWVAGSR